MRNTPGLLVAYDAEIARLSSPLQLRAVFPSALQIALGDERILTMTNAPYNGPLAVRLKEMPVSPPIGTRGEIADRRLHMGPLLVELSPDLGWQPPRPTRDLDWNLFGRHAKVVATAGTQLYRAGEGAIAWKRHICDVADELELALVMGDMDEAGRYANLLVGAGPGLTPASDDVLVGMLAGLESIARRLGKKPALPKVQKGRTTRLSDTLLEQAARGSAIEPLLDVVHTMGSPLFGQTQIRSLLAVGHTSGAAMLAGVGLAGRVMLKRWGETWSVAG